MKITGVMIYYYFICRKRLWYFISGINMEDTSQDVKIGKLIDENTYSREKRKQILVDEKINIDFLEDWKIIHEVKKSDKLENASIWQIKYYLYVLKELDIDVEMGILDYPSLRKRRKVYLEDGDVEKIEEIMEKIKSLKLMDKPETTKKKGYCNKCSYYDLCFV